MWSVAALAAAPLPAAVPALSGVVEQAATSAVAAIMTRRVLRMRKIP
jgi:hypothetical protein